MKTEPIVGKFYLVECVLVNTWHWMPIVGQWHSDAEIGVQHKHYHLDPRFIPKNKMNSSRGYTPEVATLGIVIFDYKDRPFGHCKTDPLVEPVLKRRKCYRAMPEFPHGVIQRNNVEKTLIGRKVLCGKCPHKGFPLESLPKDENGHVICNGHGLKIDMNKREVIER